ncbi:unnamed protein product [Brassica oleracea var. botrytis]|uniref:Thioredoxin domain-containing protein n=2 Tax=Brassica TaxID=3705 RepID=A0A3P6F023_BRAOL|nr:unnamed protein product [Brassica napus]CDY65919.1 BnaC01g42880D [Brassica napus]VDD50973.1 unnamed protein product [Brassica oleracea]
MDWIKSIIIMNPVGYRRTPPKALEQNNKFLHKLLLLIGNRSWAFWVLFIFSGKQIKIQTFTGYDEPGFEGTSHGLKPNTHRFVFFFLCAVLLGFRQRHSPIGMSKGMRWWEKSTKENMLEIHSANHLVDSLLKAGDRLVVLDFYSPGCGGCKSLHPKSESEELRTMCHGLNVHVLPFFKFYRGAEGKLCSFSCTISTINKFKKALEKHGSERCSLGPAKGLDSKELMALASVGELKMNLDSLTMHQDVLLSSSASSFCYKTEEQHEKMVV